MFLATSWNHVRGMSSSVTSPVLTDVTSVRTGETTKSFSYLTAILFDEIGKVQV